MSARRERKTKSRESREPLKLLPHDADRQEFIIGVLIKEPHRIAEAKARVSREDFYGELHHRTFGALENLVGQAKAIDPLAVTRYLEAHGGLTDIEKARIWKMPDVVHKGADFSDHLDEVARLARRRRMIITYQAVVNGAWNGTGDVELHELKVKANEADVSGRRARAVDLETVVPRRPRFSVDRFIREAGLHVEWGEPSAGKTWTFIRVMVEMMLGPEAGRPHLFGHPDLTIRRRYLRVLWIGTEEDGPTFSSKLHEVMAGLNLTSLPGTFYHIWASDPRRRVDMMDLPDIIETDGPFDACVLDSLTGLRPRKLEGQTIRWDLDNDATNTLCLMLRGLALTHHLDIHGLHHTGRERGRYRGPTEWWASADVMIGLEPADGKIRVKVEKSRDGRRIEPFMLAPSWTKGFTLEHEGAAPVETALPPKIRAADAYLRERRTATQAEIINGAKVSRATAQRAADTCITAGLWRDTGKKINGSPMYEHAAREV